jgi:hypothetical protein
VGAGGGGLDGSLELVLPINEADLFGQVSGQVDGVMEGQGVGQGAGQ